MQAGMEIGVREGAGLMRTSFDLVRHDPALLWFPVVSTFCLVATAGFWLFEGAWLHTVHGPGILFVPLVVVGLYSLDFVGIFFSVALAGAANAVLDGSAPSFSDGFNIAWSRLGSIARWAGYSLCVSLALSFVQRFHRWVGTAAQIAWSFATFFVVPLIAVEGMGAGDARRRSFELARMNWQAETGGLGALQAVMFVPVVLFVLAFKLLESGRVHSHPAQALLALIVLMGIALGIAAGVVRQVFAVWLYRTSVR
jgi:hypothetical protein